MTMNSPCHLRIKASSFKDIRVDEEADLMDALPAEWLCELGMEESNLMIHQSHMTGDDFDFESLSPESFHSISLSTVSSSTPSEEQVKTNNSWYTDNIIQYSSHSPSTYLVFSPNSEARLPENQNCGGGKSAGDGTANNNVSDLGSHGGSDDNLSDAFESCKGNSSREREGEAQYYSLSRPPLQAKNHVVAERNRRERLNQKLIALASLIPGLRKMDKASILGDATKYIKQLEERVQALEGEAKKKDLGESKLVSTHSIKRSRRLPLLSSEHHEQDTCTSSNDNSDGHEYDGRQLPEIHVRVSDSDKLVLLRIHCIKDDGVVAKVTTEIERSCLGVTNSSVMVFGENALEFTIVAQMGDEFSMKVKDLVKNLRSAVLKFK